jgi:IS4 transposase
MMIVSRHHEKGDPHETLTDECTVNVSAEFACRHESILAGPPFSDQDGSPRVRWRARLAAFVAILMAWDPADTLADRFDAAREAITGMFPSRRRVGSTHQGFVQAIFRLGQSLLACVIVHLRAQLRQVAGACWTREEWVAFVVDGSRADSPRTRANEQALGCGGRKGTGPQFWLTTLWHMGTGLPWAWKIGPSRDCERSHLRAMLHLLPVNSLLVADAGFVGYQLLSEIVASSRCFLVRVGGNVTLLQELGYAQVEKDGTVYLWPSTFRKAHPPLVLRLIVLVRKGKKVYLLTNLSADALSGEQAAVLYEMRWGVEVFYRSLKQTLARRKMLSHAPRQARMELHWTLVGLQLLGLMSVSAILASGKDPLSWSVALSLRVVRRAMANRRPRQSYRGGLVGQLRQAVKDTYKRTSAKKARNWPSKKKNKPPGPPRIRKATAAEVKRAEKVKSRKTAA